MIEVLDVITNVVIALEVVAAVVLIVLNIGEVRFLEHEMRPHLAEGEDLPLFEAIAVLAKYVSLVGIYLLFLTVVGAMYGPLSDYFPPIRAINAGIFLGMISLPYYIGRSLRMKRREKDEGTSTPT